MLIKYWSCFSILLLLCCMSSHSRIHQLGNLLHCSYSKDFPNGSYEKIETINFYNNNFNEFTPKLLYSHGFHNLRKAILRSNNISYVHPGAFANMSQMMQLDLSENILTTIDKKSFYGLTSLEHLHLGSNKIHSIASEVLQVFPSLKTLDLSNNLIDKLEVDFLKETLVSELDIGRNPIELPEQGPILNSTSLTRLYLQSCSLRQLPVDSFVALVRLRQLDLSRNKLESLPAGLLRSLTELEYLDISFNLITYVGVDAFYLPLNLKVFYCMGNPLKERVDCTQLLDNIRINNSERSQSSSKIDTSSTVKILYTSQDRSLSSNVPTETFTRSADTYDIISTMHQPSISNFKTDRENKKKSFFESEKVIDTVIYSIMVVSIICLILMFILLGQLCYVFSKKSLHTDYDI